MLRTLRGVKEGWSRTRARLRDKVPVVSQVGERAEANAAAAEAGHGMQQKKKLVHVQQHASVYPRMVFVDVNGRAALSVDVRSPTFEAGVTANGRTVYRVGRGREHQGGIFVSFAHRRVEGSAQPDDLIDDDEDELKELEAAPVVEAAAEGEEEAGDYGNSNDASSVYGSHFDWDNRVTFRLQRWEIGELADFTPAETSLSCKRRADDGAVKHLSFTLGSQGNTEVVCAQSADNEFVVEILLGEMRYLARWMQACIPHISGLDVMTGSVPMVVTNETVGSSPSNSQVDGVETAA